MEVSAKSGSNVDEAFETLAKEIKEHRNEQNQHQAAGESLSLRDVGKEDKQNCKC